MWTNKETKNCLCNINGYSTNILEFNSISKSIFNGGGNLVCCILYTTAILLAYGEIVHHLQLLLIILLLHSWLYKGMFGIKWFLCKKSQLINEIITFLLLNILKQRDDTVFSALVDNLWSAYSEKGSILEKKNQASVAGSEETKMGGLPYVFTDIMTYFTMLVGIYFPSVTGSSNYFSCLRRCVPIPE